MSKTEFCDKCGQNFGIDEELKAVTEMLAACHSRNESNFLRDYFAAKAIVAAAHAVPCRDSDDQHEIARRAYGLADAMLKARRA